MKVSVLDLGKPKISLTAGITDANGCRFCRALFPLESSSSEVAVSFQAPCLSWTLYFLLLLSASAFSAIAVPSSTRLSRNACVLENVTNIRSHHSFSPGTIRMQYPPWLDCIRYRRSLLHTCTTPPYFLNSSGSRW